MDKVAGAGGCARILMTKKRLWPWASLLLAGIGPAGCYDFHLTGPEDPAPLAVPAKVTVTVEYRQPAGCENATGRCDDPVVFFASWMREGGEFALTRDPSGHVWTGRAYEVPVNFPPRDDPHAVRVFDPHLFDAPSGGISAARLRIGGQLLTVFDSPGSRRESGLVYVDANGVGHNP
jgi:hypothetical protein